jgi:DNA primase
MSATISKELGEFRTTSKSDELLFCCPYCVLSGFEPDTKFHLSINTSKRVYHCYRCKKSGKLSELFGEREFFTPKEKRSIFDVLEDILESSYDEPRSVFDLDQFSVPIFEESEAYNYLTQKRGFTKKMIEVYDVRIGIGKFRNRVIIPVRDVSGNVVYFSSRTYVDSEPRYINPSVPKKSILFNANNYNGSVTLICEGCFSAVFAGLFGWEFLRELYGEKITPYNVSVAILGSYLHNEQAKIISGRCNDAVVCLDSDRSTKEKIDIANQMKSLGCNVFIVQLPKPNSGKKHDPETVGKSVFVDCLKEAFYGSR